MSCSTHPNLQDRLTPAQESANTSVLFPQENSRALKNHANHCLNMSELTLRSAPIESGACRLCMGRRFYFRFGTGPIYIGDAAVSSPLLPIYARADLAFERGEGAWLVTRDGERYLDFGAGIAVNALGHAHPHLVRALTEQAAKLWHTSNLYQIPDGERLAQRLVDHTFADVAFFTNSGAEALEAAIKITRRYHASRGEPERFRILTFEGAFHGRTLATIAAGGQQKYLEGFGPKVEGFDQVSFDDIDAAAKAITPETAAILVEPVQGEGGIRAFPTASLKRLRELCDKHGLLL